MDLKKFVSRKKNAVLGKFSVARTEEEKRRGIGAEELRDIDTEKENVEEWWLEKEMGEARRAKPEDEEEIKRKKKEGGDIKRSVPLGPAGSGWLSSLATEVTEIEAMDEQLMKVIEEVEGLGAKQILDLAETTLHEVQEVKAKIRK
jgi:hypothetical protein